MNLRMVSHIIPRRSLKQESRVLLLSISLSKQDQQWKTQRVTTRRITKKLKKINKRKVTGERHMVEQCSAECKEAKEKQWNMCGEGGWRVGEIH